MIIVGLTGSIGMGKSTAAGMFRELGVPVNDADEVVHMLYSGEAVAPVEAAFPGVAKGGVIDRAELSLRLVAAPERLAELERIVHPLVRAKEQEFVARHRADGAPFVLLDIPLLFETKAEARLDRIVVVTCDPEMQRERVMKRPGMDRREVCDDPQAAGARQREARPRRLYRRHKRQLRRHAAADPCDRR